KLPYRVLIRNKKCRATNGKIVVVLAINCEVVRAGALSVDRKSRPIAVDIADTRNNARHQQRQGVNAASCCIRGQLRYLTRFEGFGNLRLLPLEQLFASSINGYDFCHLSSLQRSIDYQVLSDDNREVFELLLFESLFFDGQGISSRQQLWQDVQPIAVGF